MNFKDKNNSVVSNINKAVNINTEKSSRFHLKKERQQFESFMDNAPLLAWITDEDGILYYMNTLFKNTFRLEDDFIGKNIYDFYPDSMKASCYASDQQVLNTNASVETFEEGAKENGEKIFFQVFKFGVKSFNKKRLIGGQALNITSKVKDKLEMIKEKDQFQSFMENTPILAWIVDEDGILMYMNTRSKNSFNYTSEHIGKKIREHHAASEREKILLPEADILANNKCLDFLHDWTNDNGETRHYRTYKFPIRNINGNRLVGCQSIEITDELQAKYSLEKSNELFEYAGKATRDIFWDWDLKNNLITRSGGYEIFFGYTMCKGPEHYNNNNIHPQDKALVTKSLYKAINANDARWQKEYRYLCADGTHKIVIDQAYIIRDCNGIAIRLIGTMQDVTEERHLQKQVLEAEIQKKKDVVTAVIDAQEKERKELSYELHDNVNQLLAASVLYLKTAQKQSSVQEGHIKQSLEYLQKAINEIRNISHNLNPDNLIINGLATGLKLLTEKLHIPDKFEVTLTLGSFIDEMKTSKSLKLALYRIVQEKISNVLRHADASKVTIYLAEEDNELVLTVTDNGKGFDAATIKKGLGLINIYNRAETFGGSAEIMSSPGAGCTMHVKIPIG